jgi:hypothetical protein
MNRFRTAVLVLAVTATLGGAAFAASSDRHVMTVALPDGSFAQIEYRGDVPPKVISVPAQHAAAVPRMPVALMDPRLAAPFDDAFFAQFAAMDAMMARQMQVMQAMAQQSAVQPGGVHKASSVGSNGVHFCSQSVTVTNPGGNAPAKVVTETHGDCGGSAAAPKASAPAVAPAAAPAAPLTIVKATASTPAKLATTTI